MTVLEIAAALAVSVASTAAADHFLEDLRCALARHDRQAVAAMFEYPATIIARGVRVPIGDRNTLMKAYDLAFPPEFQGVIAMARMPAPGLPISPYRVTVDRESLTIGSSWLWARRVGSSYRIARIILPGPWVAIGAAAAAQPRRVEFFDGRSATHMSGTLNPFEMQSYIIGVSRGQRLDLKLEGFPGRDVVMRVLDRKSGRPVDDRGADGVRGWTAALGESGDVRVDVIRLSPESKPAPLYILSVGLR